MKQGNNFERVLGVVAGIVIIWLLIINQDKKRKIIVLEEELKSNEELTDQIKKSLKELISNNPDIDSDIANELAQIAALIEIKQETKAILGLAKIIENLLKELYKGNAELKEFAKERKRNKL